MLIEGVLIGIFAVAGNAAEAAFVCRRIEEMLVHRALVAEVAVARSTAKRRVVNGGFLEMLIECCLGGEFTVAGGALEVGGAFGGGVARPGGDSGGLWYGFAPVPVEAVLGQ